MSSIANDKFHAALQTLENMAKSGATQLYHTSSDSDPGQHAGTSTTDYQDEHKDGIDENGTDYTGVKKALAAKVEKSQALTPAEVAIVKGQDPRALIADKVAKGQALTAAESWAVKGGFAGISKGTDKPGKAGTPGEAKDASSVPETNAGDNNDEDIEADAKKSLAGAVAQTKELRKGLEMSPILAEFARAMGTALEGTEARVQKSVFAALAPIVERVAQIESVVKSQAAQQNEFNKGFAETLVGIGQHVAGSGEAAAAQASQPAGAPKSQFRAQAGNNGVQPIQKSFGPGGLPNGQDALAKSQIVETMYELVKSNKINSLEVCKFEMTGEISPAVQQMVLAHASGQR